MKSIGLPLLPIDPGCGILMPCSAAWKCQAVFWADKDNQEFASQALFTAIISMSALQTGTPPRYAASLTGILDCHLLHMQDHTQCVLPSTIQVSWAKIGRHD